MKALVATCALSLCALAAVAAPANTAAPSATTDGIARLSDADQRRTQIPRPAHPVPNPRQPWIVGVGDSLMSGEGAIFAGRKAVRGDASDWGMQVTGLPQHVYENEADPTAPSHRSFCAPVHLGPGWNSKNFAVTGARADSGVYAGSWKPGVDAAGQLGGLASFARQHDVRAVALSIGANDFGFNELAKQVTVAYLTGQDDPTAIADEFLAKENLANVEAGVARAIGKTAEAMQEAGKNPSEWRLVYQLPPVLIAPPEQAKFRESSAFNALRRGGVPASDQQLRWLTTTCAAQLRAAMLNGVKAAQAANPALRLVVADCTNAFNGHRLNDIQTATHSAPEDLELMPCPSWGPGCGSDTEWVNPLDLASALRGNKDWSLAALHPNFWGQRALAACLLKTLESPDSTLVELRPTDSASGTTQTPSTGPIMRVSARVDLTKA